MRRWPIGRSILCGANASPMKILWLTWKDREHPLAGGAEVVNEELAKRLVRDGHEVKFIVGGFAGGTAEATRDGFSIVRVGGRVSVYWQAYRYYKKNLRGWADKVIDEVNTIPFFARFYVKEPSILFVHQLAREIWFYEMMFPLSLIGYLIEPLYLRLLSAAAVITVSESTKKDLQRFGFKSEAIHIISEGIEMEPVKDLPVIKKAERPTMLALGSVRAMKRTGMVLEAFEYAKQQHPALTLIIAGNMQGSYGQQIAERARTSRFSQDIVLAGSVSADQKQDLLQKAHVLCMASVKEGWGLVVTEANSQGTPAVVCDVDGLRDSVRNRETGIVCAAGAQSMGRAVLEMLADEGRYQEMRRKGWEWSGEMGFEKGYTQFLEQL